MSVNAETAEKSSSTSSLIKAIVSLTVFLAVGGGIAYYVYIRITDRPTLRDDHWQEVLTSSYPILENPLSPREALDILDSFPGARGARWLQGSFRGDPLFGPDASWDPLENPNVATGIGVFESAEFKTWLEYIPQITQRRWYEPPTVQLSTSDLASSGVAPYSRLLRAYARYAWQVNGDHEQALRSWRFMLEFAHHCSLDRASISASQYAKMVDSVTDEIELFAADNQSIDGCDAFVSDVMNLFQPLEPVEVVATELVRARAFFDACYGANTGWLDIKEAALRSYGVSNTNPFWNLASPVFYTREEADRALKNFEAELQSMEALRGSRYYNSVYIQPDCRWSDMTFYDSRAESNCVSVVGKWFEVQTNVEATMTLLALGAYYRDHQDYPISLNELVPKYLPRTPVDYFDNRMLRYRKQEERYLLYSVWKDSKDTGGEPALNPNKYQESSDKVYGLIPTTK